MADLVLLEPGTSVFSGGEVRVAILPVGDVPRHAMDAYMGCINQSRHIPLSSMRAHYRESAQKTPFGNLDWEKGFMHFRFLNLDEARKKSRTCDLHRQRQVVAVLGVVHCPWTPSLHGAHAEFSKMCSLLFPEAPIQRCLLANPTKDHLHQSRESSYESMILFQPGGGLRHLEHEFSFWLHDLAAQILAELEHWVLNASPLGMPMGPACYADSPEFTCSTPVMEDIARRFTLDEDEAHEKKRWGRLMKTKGDLCLMAGSCQDAFDHYRTCSDLARVSNDLVWYGGAVEGMATARVLQTLAGATSCPFLAQQGQPGQIEPWMVEPSSAGMSAFAHPEMARALQLAGVEGEVRNLLLDARSTYRKKGGVPAASIEVALKLARLTAFLKGGSGKDVQQEITDLVGAVLEAVPGLVASVEDRMVALEEAASVLRMVGPTRKRSLLLWHACELAARVSGPRGGGGLAVRMDTLRLAAQALTPPHRVRSLPAASGTRAGDTAASASAAAANASAAGADATAAAVDTAAQTGLAAAGAASGAVGSEAPKGGSPEGGGETEGGDQQQSIAMEEEGSARPEERLPHWAQQGVWHAGAPPWGQSWACLPPSLRMHYLATVAPALLGGVSAAKQDVQPSTPGISHSSSTGNMGKASASKSRLCGIGATPRGDDSSASGLDSTKSTTQQAGQGSEVEGSGDSVSSTASSLASGPTPQPGSSRPSMSSHGGRPSQAKPSDRGGNGSSNVQGKHTWHASAEKHTLAARHVASLACGPPMWGQLRRGLLETALQAAQQTNSMNDLWEVCGALLRDHHTSLTAAQQSSLLQAASQAATSLTAGPELAHALMGGGADGMHVWQEEGPARCGPGPVAVLSRIVPAALGLQPLCFSVATVTGAPGGNSSGSPFIFNPSTAKKAEGQAMAAAAAAARMWCAGEHGSVEVWLSNPLSVPLKLDAISLQTNLVPDNTPSPLPTPTLPPNITNTTDSALPTSAPSPPLLSTTSCSLPCASTSGHGQHKSWEPRALGPLVVPPGGQPMRVLLQGRAMCAGRLQLLGLHASMWGVTWLQPFVQLPAFNPLQATLRGLNSSKNSSRASANSSANPAWNSKGSGVAGEGLEPLTVVPPLPMLHGVLLGPQGLKVAAPPEPGSPSKSVQGNPRATRGTPALHAAPATGLDVWEGQSMECRLVLTNPTDSPSRLSVASARLMVMNAKGGIVKPLPRTRNAHASLTGVALDVDDAALQAAMPLPAGASVSLPVGVRVGSVPAGTPELSVALEVSILYAAAATGSQQQQQQQQQQQEQPQKQALFPLPSFIPPGHIVGRRLVLPLTFRVRPALRICSASFLMQHTPLRNGCRCRQLPLPAQAPTHPAHQTAHTLPHIAPSHPLPTHPVHASTTTPAHAPKSNPLLNIEAKLHPSNIAHHLQAAFEPLTAPGEKLRAALGEMIGHGSSKHRQQEHLPTSTPAGKVSASEGNTQQAGTLPPHQSHVPPTIDGAAHVAHEGGGNSGQASLEGSFQQHQQQHQQRQQERQNQAVRGLTWSVLEGCETVDAWTGTEEAAAGGAAAGAAAAAAAAAGHSASLTPSNDVSDGAHHAGNDKRLCEGPATDACVALPALESHQLAQQEGRVLVGLGHPHAQQQQGQVLLGLAADSVLSVGVTNHSSTNCFEVQLSREASGLGKGSRWPEEPSEGSQEVDLEPGSRSPPVVLRPGESTSLLTYLSGTTAAAPQRTHGSPAAGHSAGSATLTSSGESLHSTWQNKAGVNGGVEACDHASAVAFIWEPSGGNAEVAADAAAAAWVVVWRQVDAQSAAGGTASATAAAPAPVPVPAACQGGVQDAPRGVCWLSAVDLAKNMTAPAAVTLHPPPLHFSLHVVSYTSHPCTEPPFPSISSSCDIPCCGVHPCLHDVTGPLAKAGALASHSRLQQLWAVGTGLGEVLEVRVGLSSFSTVAPYSTPPVTPPLASSTSLPPASSARPEVEEVLGARNQGQHSEEAAVEGRGGHEWQRSPPLHVCFNIAITRVVPDGGRDAQQGNAEEGWHDHGNGVGAPEDGAGGRDSKWWTSTSRSGGASAEECVPKGSSGSLYAEGSSGSNIDEGVVLVSGATHNVHVGLLPGRVHWQPMLLSFTRPGLYQVHVTDVAAAPLPMPLTTTSGLPFGQVYSSPEHQDGLDHEVGHEDGPKHEDEPEQRDSIQQPCTQQGAVAASQMDGACNEGDDGALDMVVAASVLRGSVMGRATLAPTPAWVDALNVLALAPAPTEGTSLGA